MKVVIAPDSFKDALRANKAAYAIADGLRSIVPDAEIDLCPVADGGEGFTSALTFGRDHYNPHAETLDPLGRKIKAAWAMRLNEDREPATAVIELAAASGLELLGHDERDPALTTTAGTGMLIRFAAAEGAKRIILGIGGSATNDAGVGIVQALGMKLGYTGSSEPHPFFKGRELQSIHSIEPGRPRHLPDGVELLVACDVDNPLTGPNGAAHVYAPQKGATPHQVEQLDSGLRHIANIWREQCGVDVEQLPGAGAAGGVGGGLVAMLGAELVPGARLVLDTVGFDERAADADLVITGEGRLDRQSLSGKAAMAVAKRCKALGVPCFALVGSVGEGADEALAGQLTGCRVIGQGLSPGESIRRTGELLGQAAAQLAREQLHS